MATDLKTHINNFQHWLKTDQDKAATWQKDREERLAWYRKHLARDRIGKLTSDELTTLIKNLWATNIWHKKDYKAEKIIKENGLDRVRTSLEELFYGDAPLENRWDAFRATIKGFGPSSLSEILTFHDAQVYALVNLKPYRVLPLIGFSINPVNDGKSYRKAIEEIGNVKSLLREYDLKDADYIFTDFFIAYLFYNVFDLQFKREEKPQPPVQPGQEPKPPFGGSILPDAPPIETHEAAEAILLRLGNLLGYDTYTPDVSKTFNGEKLGDIATLEELPDFTSAKIMESVQNIDVVWVREEYPGFFFEVEHTTGVTSGLLRIYQAEKVDARFFIVGPREVLRKYEREVEKAPFHRIKSKYHFRSYEELREMYVVAARYREASDRFFE
ncbi:MAG: hypothetical protein WBN92_02290 [Terriglobia bacterium]